MATWTETAKLLDNNTFALEHDVAVFNQHISPEGRHTPEWDNYRMWVGSLRDRVKNVLPKLSVGDPRLDAFVAEYNPLLTRGLVQFGLPTGARPMVFATPASAPTQGKPQPAGAPAPSSPAGLPWGSVSVPGFPASSGTTTGSGKPDSKADSTLPLVLGGLALVGLLLYKNKG